MDELETLKNTVESIRVVLLDAEDKQEAQNHAVQNWVRRLKDVLLPADDLLDEFFIEDTRRKRDEAHENKVTKVLHSLSLSPNKIFFRRKMAHEIEKIQRKFNDLVKHEEKEWIDVLRGDFWKLCEDKESILPVLKLSYHNLSPQQRQCFSYCSLFPKNWEIEKDELVKMWMAQGYLDSSVNGKCMEDVGNEFVNIFLMKSLFQDANKNQDGDIICFKMHDLMHDLATQVAANDCCYFDNKEKICLGRPVHVSAEFDAFCLLESLEVTRLRTLIIWASHANNKLDGEKLSVISNFKNLRVLKLIDSPFSKLSCSIEKLKHLRYLNLSEYDGLESLPKSISNLVCLQTIQLFLDQKVVVSTEVISKLINLRHIEISGHVKHTRQSIRFENYRIQQHKGVIFSKWLSPLTNIVEISLDHCQYLSYLPPLERLPFLKTLKLSHLYELEYIYFEEPILLELFFPSLESLIFLQCKKLRGWRRTGDNSNDINSSHNLLLHQFPCLSKLQIRWCQMLTYMPTFPKIERLLLIGCSAEIFEATLNIAVSHYSISSAPLSMLKSFVINQTIMDAKNVPQDWWQNLTSLENLDFAYLSSQHFQVIEKWFKGCFDCLPSLQRITFEGCSYLRVLPEWICNISSLHHIKVNCCRNLALLPEGMPRLTNLHTLEVIECRFLVAECQKETSATRSKISRIPNIIIKRDWNWDLDRRIVCTG